MKSIQTIRKSFGVLSIAAMFALSVLGGSLFVAGNNNASAASASLRMYNRCNHTRDVFVYNQSSMRLLWSGSIKPGQSAVAYVPTYITLKINSPKKNYYSYSVPSVYVYAPVALSTTICR